MVVWVVIVRGGNTDSVDRGGGNDGDISDSRDNNDNWGDNYGVDDIDKKIMMIVVITDN